VKSEKPNRIRDTVYVVGAGFSAGLGYPLTKSLPIDVWERLPVESREQLKLIIEFHHPAFTPARKTSFPDIEQLLTEMAVNPSNQKTGFQWEERPGPEHLSRPRTPPAPATISSSISATWRRNRRSESARALTGRV
jgi:hypothetical protein